MEMEKGTLGILFLVIVLVVAFGTFVYSQEHEHGKVQQEKNEQKGMMGHMDKMMGQCQHMMKNMDMMMAKKCPGSMGMMNMKGMMMQMQNMSQQMKHMMANME